jgi:hypothetical protein
MLPEIFKSSLVIGSVYRFHETANRVYDFIAAIKVAVKGVLIDCSRLFPVQNAFLLVEIHWQ